MQVLANTSDFQAGYLFCPFSEKVPERAPARNPLPLLHLYKALSHTGKVCQYESCTR
jgi:hypothetical protein